MRRTGAGGEGEESVRAYYEHAGITIYHGDCREILPTLPKPSVLIFDPPYGCNVRYGDAYDDDRDIYWDWFLFLLSQFCAPFARAWLSRMGLRACP